MFVIKAFGHEYMLAEKKVETHLEAVASVNEITASNSPLSDVIQYVEVWWNGSLIDSIVPKWLSIPDADIPAEDFEIGPGMDDFLGWISH